jgi:hypothetical protein
MGAITKLSAGHESTWTFVVPNTEVIRGVPSESGLGNRKNGPLLLSSADTLVDTLADTLSPIPDLAPQVT